MFKKILVAIDGSPYSELALPAAMEMASRFEASLLVVHVAEHDRGRTVAYSTESPVDGTRMVADAVQQARDAGIKAEGALLDRAAGHVAQAIAEIAKAREADLVVMGSRGLTDAQGIALGSVTHGVIHLVEVPALIVRPPRDGKMRRPAGVAARVS